MTQRRRVAITGIGMVTPVGNNVETSWANLLAGRSGIGPIRQFDASGFPVHIGAEVHRAESDRLPCDPELLKLVSRSHRFALTAAEEALADAGVRPSARTRHRWGLSIGAGMLGVNFSEFQSVHDFCAPNDEFNPDGLLDAEFPADPVAFCRSQTNT